MILKIQKPILSTEGELYLIYNKTKSIMLQDIEVGQVPKLDNMLKDESKIYVEGYIDKKGRLRIKKKIKNQEW